MKKLVTLVAVAMMLFMIAGCADPPQQLMDEAKSALDAAKNAEADRYVPELYNAAKKMLDDALALVEKEKEGWFSSYDEAINQLNAAKESANKAAEAVAAKKEEVKTAVENMLKEITAAVEKTKSLWKKAPRGKGTREALQMIKNDIEKTEASVAEVNTALQSGDYLSAQEKAQAIMKKLQSLQSELQ
jgi:predicted small lipoprotein YifL